MFVTAAYNKRSVVSLVINLLKDIIVLDFNTFSRTLNHLIHLPTDLNYTYLPWLEQRVKERAGRKNHG